MELCVCFWHFSDIDDLTACDGIKFWMSDGERPVLCRVSHEALRDLAERVHFEGTDEKVFEAYRELIEQVASDAYDAGTSFDDAGLVLVTSEALARVGRSAVLVAKSQNFDQVAIEEGFEPLALVSRTQFHSIDE